MTHDIRLLTEADLRRTVALDLNIIDRIEEAFASLARGAVVMPPVLSMALPDINAEVDVKTAYVPGLDGFAIKVSPGFFDNPSRGLPSLNGLMVLLSAETGLVTAVFLDNGYLTDIRTAAAGAVAARHLAPEDTATAGIIGTGVQARLQLIAAAKTRALREALIWGRDMERAERLAAEIGRSLGIKASACADRADLVARSQLVVTTTPARTPVLDADWLHEGLHITAMGADQDDKNELDPQIFARADRIVCDRVSQCRMLGELRSAFAEGIERTDIAELGDVVLGNTSGRTRPEDITVCDLTGTGVQDTAIATLALARVRKAQAGTLVHA